MKTGMRILVMGLPGSGKTTFATRLAEKLGADHLNADVVRKEYDDWDFSEEGRVRQSERMYMLSRKSSTKYVVMDFVCPLPSCRSKIDSQFVIWMDTIKESRFDDTNLMFIRPDEDLVDLTLSKYGTEDDINFVVDKLDKLSKV